MDIHRLLTAIAKSEGSLGSSPVVGGRTSVGVRREQPSVVPVCTASPAPLTGSQAAYMGTDGSLYPSLQSSRRRLDTAVRRRG